MSDVPKPRGPVHRSVARGHKSVPHDHRVFVEGCFRCELSADEMRAHHTEVRGRLRQLVGGKDSPWNSLEQMVSHLRWAAAQPDDEHGDGWYARERLAAAADLLEANK